MKKIAVVGAHGTGKTTLCCNLMARCQDNQFCVEMIPEIIRMCPLPIHEEQTIESTLWIACRQIELELEAEHRSPDFLICDRTAIDPLVYLWAYHPNEHLDDHMAGFIEDYFRVSYGEIYLVRPSEKKIDNDEFRLMDKEFQYRVHDIFAYWLGGHYTNVDSDDIFGENTDKLCKKILGF